MLDLNKKTQKEDALTLFRDFFSYLHHHFQIDAIILFGSRARNEALFYSDYDVLVIGKFQQSYLKRMETLVQHLPQSVAVDLFCYTPREFQQFVHIKKLHVMDALHNGIVLYERDEYLHKVSGNVH